MLCHPQQVVTSKYARNASRVKENAASSLRTQFVVFVRFIPTFKISTIGNLFIFHPIQYRFDKRERTLPSFYFFPIRKFLMTLCRAYELMNFIDFFRQFLNRLRPTRTNAKTIIIIVALVV